MKVSVVKETAPGERRVALVPETIGKLTAAGLEVLVESGAGDSAWLTDDSYAEAGASVVSRNEAMAADVLLMVGKPDEAAIAAMHEGQVAIGVFAPLADPGLAEGLAGAGVTAVSLDMIPRTLPRAQPMEAALRACSVCWCSAWDSACGGGAPSAAQGGLKTREPPPESCRRGGACSR